MKPRIKRVMRVATTFTGAAACAVAVNPAALAGTGQPAAQTGHQQHLRRLAVDGNSRAQGSIREGACTDANWLHVEGPEGSEECFGYRGLLRLSPYPNMRAFCGGNNSGQIWGGGPLGWSSYGVARDNYWFHLPKSISWFYISEIGIWGWKGNDKCPAL